MKHGVWFQIRFRITGKCTEVCMSFPYFWYLMLGKNKSGSVLHLPLCLYDFQSPSAQLDIPPIYFYSQHGCGWRDKQPWIGWSVFSCFSKILVEKSHWCDSLWVTMWENVPSDTHPVETQISLRIQAIWAESLLCACRNFASLAIQIAPFIDSDQTVWSAGWCDVLLGTCLKVHFLVPKCNSAWQKCPYHVQISSHARLRNTFIIYLLMIALSNS